MKFERGTHGLADALSHRPSAPDVDNTETIDNMANEYVKPYRKIVQKGGDENALRGTIRPRPRIWSYNIADSKAKASTFQSHLSLLAYTSFSNAITKTLLAREASKHIFRLFQTGKYSRLQLLVEHCALRNVDTTNLEFHSPRDTQAQDKSRSPRAHVCIHGRSLYFTAGDVPLCAPSVRPHTACFRHRIKRDEARRNSKGAKRPMREE